MESYRQLFQRDNFDPERIARELYDPERLGGVVVPHFLLSDVTENLLQEIQRQARFFERAPYHQGKARQEFDYFKIGEADDEDDNKVRGDFPMMFALRNLYAEVCRDLAREAHFSGQGYPNSITVQRYWQGSLGITPHRDESRSINLISIFVLSGYAPFYVCSDRRDGTYLPAGRIVYFFPSAGDMILLSAPRTDEEKDLRPLHSVSVVTAERHAITFRERRPSLIVTAHHR